jgi:hypothetical protein
VLRHGWIALLCAACVVRVATPFHLPPPDPAPEPAAANASPPPDMRAERRADHERARRVAHEYDELLDGLARADREASARQDEDAAMSCRQAVEAADQLLDEVADPRAPAAIYPTRSDGPLDRATLIAKLQDVRARADRLGKAAHDRALAALATELHARTPQQRAVVADHGRPDEVQQRRRQICWIYRADIEEAYCWTAAGRLARHDRTELVSRQPATSGPPTQRAPEPEPTKPAKPPTRLYYAAATFAAGSCSSGDCFRYGWTTSLPDGDSARTSCSSGECAKYGWTTDFPHGDSARTSCSSGDCMKYGWTTDFPDSESARTSCNSGECMKYGWSTSLPHGQSASSSCNSGDCLKYGWSTSLPSGSVSCSCNSGDCTKYGASCN